MRNFKDIKRVIIKVGSSSLVNKDLSVNNEIIIAILSVFKKADIAPIENPIEFFSFSFLDKFINEELYI